MSTVSQALRNEETRAGGRRTVAGVVNSIETLEGGGFLVLAIIIGSTRPGRKGEAVALQEREVQRLGDTRSHKARGSL